MSTSKPALRSQREYREGIIEDLESFPGVTRLRAWNEFVEEVTLPTDLAAALATGRIELLRLVRPRALTAEEAAQLYHLIGVLIETNMTLQAHAKAVATMTTDISAALKGTAAMFRHVEHFANFRHDQSKDEA